MPGRAWTAQTGGLEQSRYIREAPPIYAAAGSQKLRRYNGFTACAHGLRQLGARICGAFATLVRNHPNRRVVPVGKNHFG
jgi:hypothetical protein